MEHATTMDKTGSSFIGRVVLRPATAVILIGLVWYVCGVNVVACALAVIVVIAIPNYVEGRQAVAADAVLTAQGRNRAEIEGYMRELVEADKRVAAVDERIAEVNRQWQAKWDNQQLLYARPGSAASAVRKMAALQLEVELCKEAMAEMSRQLEGKGGAETHSDYVAVGLSQGAPDYLIEAAQKAHRVAMHPDRQTPAKRAAANARFAEMEACFGRIRKRG